jgi:hypothetical protein
MDGLDPRMGSVNGSRDPLCGYTSRLRLFGECCSYSFCGTCLLGWGARSWDDVSHFLGGSSHGRCSHTMVGGLEIRVLDDVNTWSLVGSGCGSFWRGPLHWIHEGGLPMGSIPGTSHW